MPRKLAISNHSYATHLKSRRGLLWMVDCVAPQASEVSDSECATSNQTQ